MSATLCRTSTDRCPFNAAMVFSRLLYGVVGIVLAGLAYARLLTMTGDAIPAAILTLMAGLAVVVTINGTNRRR